jgi:hypothetical protein
MDLNERWMEQFKIRSWPQYHYDLDTAKLTFSKDRHPKVVANIVETGTVQGDEWEWAWGNSHTPAGMRDQMSAVRDFGEEKQWTKLNTLFLKSDKYLGWELTAISAHLLNAQGMYRCPYSDKPDHFIYFLAFNIRFVQ